MKLNLHRMKKQSLASIFLVFTLLVSSQNRDKKSLEGSKISFTENKGQICDQNFNLRPDVLFSGNYKGLNYHLFKSGVSYQIFKVNSSQKANVNKNNNTKELPSEYTIYRVDINWLGASEKCKITSSDEVNGVNNYYFKHCSQGITNVKSYSGIVYSNIYNNIDLKWHSNNDELEYDFIVNPGADLNQIAFKIEGASNISINSLGELLISTPLGVIKEKKPVAYQEGRQVEASWVVKGNMVNFNVGNYDKSKTLVIDPAITIWGSYYGGNSNDYVRGNATNGSDETYIAGETQSVGNIATSGAYQITYANGTDAFVAKFNAAGVRQWGTYIGGSSSDKANSVSSDIASGSVYVVGQTNGTSFPVTGGAHQATSAGLTEGFISKFNSSGALQWSTFYGGTGTEEIFSCSLDNLGNLLVCGVSTSTASGTQIATIGSHQPASALGPDDAFLVKFTSAGVRVWGTYYGGSGTETAHSCSTDISGNIYMCGVTSTSSGTAIATAGAQQLVKNGTLDAFLVKFNSIGVRQWGTFYGASGGNWGYACSTFSNNVVYLAGIGAPGAVSLISTTGAHQTACSGSSDGFLAKFDGNGIRQWGTYYGGSSSIDGVNGVCVSTTGDVFICGITGSSNNISTSGSHQFTYGGGANDAYLAKFNSSGVRQWGTYYGGALADQANVCSTNTLNNIYISGSTGSTVSIATTGAHQTVYGGFSNDGFHSKIKDCSNSLTLSIAGTNTLCAGQSATLSATGLGFTTYTWSSGPNTSSISVSPTSSTTYTLVAGTATVGCNYTAQHTISVNIQPTVNVVVTPTSALVCSGNSATLIATGASTYSWSTGALTNSIVVTPTALAQPIVTGYNGTCSHSLMTNVGVSPTPTINITGAPTATFCSGNTFSMTASGASTYTWSNGPTTATNLVTPTVVTIYTVTGSLGPCNSTKTISVNMITTPTVNVSTSANAICTGGNATLTAFGASTYSWNTSATNSIIVVSPTVNTTYTVTGYNGSCSNTKTIAVTMTTNIAMTASANPNVLCSMSQLTLTSTGATNYTWSTAALTNTDVVSPISSDTYTVYGTSGSCTGSAVVSVTVNPLPTINTTSNPTLICLNGTVTLNASGAQTYTWMPGNLVGATQTNTPNSTTIYTVTGTDASLCSNTQTIQVNVDPCTGVKEYRNESVEVYPNPNNGSFTINGSKMGHYFIINSIGQIVSEFFIDEQKQNINISNLPSGIYQIKGNDISKKIIVLK